jgi:hypothetical protein
MQPEERLWTVLLTALGAMYLWASFTMSIWPIPGVPPANAVPIVLGSIFVFLCLVTLLRDGQNGRLLPSIRWRSSEPRLEVMLILLVAYVLSLKWIGFLAGTGSFLFLSMLYLRPRRARVAVVGLWALLVTLLLWIVFGRLLGLRLPIGRIWD